MNEFFIFHIFTVSPLCPRFVPTLSPLAFLAFPLSKVSLSPLSPPFWRSQPVNLPCGCGFGLVFGGLGVGFGRGWARLGVPVLAPAGVRPGLRPGAGQWGGLRPGAVA